MAVLCLAGVAQGAGPAKPTSRPSGQPATRPAGEERHHIPGVKADANGYPTGPLPALAWRPTGPGPAAERYNGWVQRREKLANTVPDMSERGAARIAKLKAAKINPNQKEPALYLKSGISFRTEADRQKEVDGAQSAIDTGKRAAWEAYDPRRIPGTRLPPDSYEWVAPATNPSAP